MQNFGVKRNFQFLWESLKQISQQNSKVKIPFLNGIPY